MDVSVEIRRFLRACFLFNSVHTPMLARGQTDHAFRVHCFQLVSVRTAWVLDGKYVIPWLDVDWCCDLQNGINF